MLALIIHLHKGLLCDHRENLPQEASGDLLQWLNKNWDYPTKTGTVQQELGLFNKNWDCPVRAPMLMMLHERLIPGRSSQKTYLTDWPRLLDKYDTESQETQYLTIVGLQNGNFIWFGLIAESILGMGYSWFRLHSLPSLLLPSPIKEVAKHA